MKRTTTLARAQVGPTFGDLLTAAGKTPASIEVERGISYSVTYRAKRGIPPGRVYLRDLAAAVGVTEDECRAAIARSAKVFARRSA